MSYNILKKNVKFSGPVSGTIEGMVDTSTDQTIGGQKAFSHTITSSADVMVSGSGKVSASFYYGDGSNLSGLPSGVGGSNTQVQFNDDGDHGGSSNFTFATGSSTLSVNTGSVEVLSASNYVSASAYYGDASNLINITADSVLAQNIVGQLSASQISTSVGLTSDSNNLAVNLATDGGITDSSGLNINISDLNAVNWSSDGEYIAIDRGGTTKKIALTELEDNLTINASNIDNGTIGNTYLPQTINRQTISASIGISGAFFQGDGSGLTGVTGAPTPVGSNTEIQFNADGALGSSAGLTFSTGSNRLSVTGEVSASSNGLFGGYVSASAFAIDGGTIIDANADIVCGNITMQDGVGALNFGNNQISGSGNISGSQFYGDGHTLNNVPMTSYINNGIVFVDNPTQKTITSNTNLTYNTNLTLTAGDLVVSTGNITASGHVSASTYYGDASNLTNIPAGSPAGANTQIQLNADGAFGASSKFTFATSSATLEIAKSTTTSNAAKIFFASGSDGSGSFITSNADDDFQFDTGLVDKDILFIVHPTNLVTKNTKVQIAGNTSDKGVCIGSNTGWGTQTLYVGNCTGHTNSATTIKFANTSNKSVDLRLSSSNGTTTFLNSTGSDDFTISHEGGDMSLYSSNNLNLSASNNLNLSASSNIGITGSTGLVAEFDSTSDYLFKARKLYYKEITFQLASSLSGGDVVWLPMGGTLNDIASQQYYTKFIAPFDGEIVKVMLRADLAAGGGSYTLKSYKASNATEHPTTLMETESILLNSTANTTRTANFTTSTFSAGDVLGFDLTLPSPWSPASSIGVNATIVIAYDELS